MLNYSEWVAQNIEITTGWDEHGHKPYTGFLFEGKECRFPTFMAMASARRALYDNYRKDHAVPYETKDSGERQEFASGMRRDVQTGKPRYDLCWVEGLPREEQLMHRWAQLMARGAEKYGERNYQLANSPEEAARFKASAFRHFMAWFAGEYDEDHAAAVCYGLMGYEMMRSRGQA